MGKHFQLITLGTDGFTNWVATVDGSKHNLGPIGVAQLVRKVVPDSVGIKVLKTFLDKGVVMFRADKEKLDKTLKLAAEFTDRAPKVGATVINPQFLKDIKAVQRHIKALDEATSHKATNLDQGLDHLVRLASKLATTPATMEEAELTKSLEVAEDITRSASEVVAKVDELVAQGANINASRAKNDVREVTVRVASVLNSGVDGVEASRKLNVLSKEMRRLHSLFYPKS